MIKNSKIAIIIPVYNEAESLRDLFYKIDGVHKILKDSYSAKFFIINDGSGDMSGEMLDKKYGGEPHVEVVHHERNLGYGEGLKTGFQKAIDQDYEYIITIDADTNYDQFLIPYFIYEFNPEMEDIMSASPWHPECSRNNFPVIRFVLSYTMSRLYQYVLKPECQPLTCYSACFRLYKKEVIENIKHNSDDFLTNAEIISRALLKGYRVREMPINVNYRMFGTSKMRKMRQIFRQFEYMHYLLRNKKQLGH